MFFVNLKAHYEELSVYEQEVIDNLMKQDNIEAHTLKSIGTALHLSASTIVRAGKKLGYATFNELKYDLRRSKESNQESHHLEASHFDLMKAQLTDEFQRTMALLDQADFESVADRVLAARRVFCVGIGSSYMPMSDFNRKLKLIDVWANDFFEQYSIERIPDIATKEDVIVVFSLGGANKTVNETLLKARQKGTHIVAITSLTHHPLAKLSDQLIQIYDAPKARKKIRSRLMLNLAGTLLFETLLKRQAAQQEHA